MALLIDETNKKELKDALGITKLEAEVAELKAAAAKQASQANSGSGNT